MCVSIKAFCASPFWFGYILAGVTAWIKVNPPSLKGGQFGPEGWVLCYLINNQLPKVGIHSLIPLWSWCRQELAVCCSPSLTLRRKRHHCRHTAPRSQKTVWRLKNPQFAADHRTQSPSALSVRVLQGSRALVNMSPTYLSLRLIFMFSACIRAEFGNAGTRMHAQTAQGWLNMLHLSNRDVFFSCVILNCPVHVIGNTVNWGMSCHFDTS